MRPISLPLGLSLLLFGALLITGCNTGTREVTRDSPYLALVPQRYLTKVDLYLYQLPNKATPYLGVNDGKLGFRDLMLPNIVSAQYVGQTYHSARILNVVPAGTELSVTRVYRDVSSQGVVVWFECDISLKTQRVQNVSTSFIQSSINGRNGQLPVIDPLIAERIE